MVKEWDAVSQVFSSVVFLEMKEIHLGSIWCYSIDVIQFTPELLCFCIAHISSSISPVAKACSKTTSYIYLTVTYMTLNSLTFVEYLKKLSGYQTW